MKKTLAVFLFILVQTASAETALVDRYSFNLLKQASAPQAVTIINQEKSQHGEDSLVSGLLFSYKDRKATDVHIAGDFSNWKPRPMQRGNNGVWFYFLPEHETDSSIRYKFMINGIWSYDPQNNRISDDGIGSFISLTETNISEELKHVTYKEINENGISFIEFRTWQPEAAFVSVAGDFNNWNPENDPMTRSEGGLWKTRINIPPGTYRYKLIIDGKWTVDLYNPKTASDGVDGICSVLTVRK